MFCVLVLLCCLFFFFKQKTAYEMRISDWSSDVCSSDLLLAAEGVALAGGTDAGDDPLPLARAADALVDFSIPAALDANLAAARAARTPIVIGTTGLGDAHHALNDAAAREIAVLQPGNTSLGVTLPATLVREGAERRGPARDIAICQMHHRYQDDATIGSESCKD